MLLKKPDWSLWIDLAHVSLTEAVALSCDIEPSSLSGPPQYALVKVPIYIEFKRRYKIAESHLLDGRLQAVTHGMGRHSPNVELRKFRAWAANLEQRWTFPKAFPKAAVEPSDSTPRRRARREAELGNKERNCLLNIIVAMRDLLLTKEGGGFPSQARIIEALLLPKRRPGVSRRNLEIAFAAKT